MFVLLLSFTISFLHPALSKSIFTCKKTIFSIKFQDTVHKMLQRKSNQKETKRESLASKKIWTMKRIAKIGKPSRLKTNSLELNYTSNPQVDKIFCIC